jgi:hypothetical protein
MNNFAVNIVKKAVHRINSKKPVIDSNNAAKQFGGFGKDVSLLTGTGTGTVLAIVYTDKELRAHNRTPCKVFGKLISGPHNSKDDAGMLGWKQRLVSFSSANNDIFYKIKLINKKEQALAEANLTKIPDKNRI